MASRSMVRCPTLGKSRHTNLEREAALGNTIETGLARETMSYDYAGPYALGDTCHIFTGIYLTWSSAGVVCMYESWCEVPCGCAAVVISHAVATGISVAGGLDLPPSMCAHEQKTSLLVDEDC